MERRSDGPMGSPIGSQAPTTEEERDEARIAAMLRSATVEVRAGFRDSVMARIAALPAAARPLRAPARGGNRWAAAAAIALLLTGLFALAGVVGSRGGDSGSFASLLAALGDFAGTSVLTGAGLLVASWRGAGLAVREALGGSVLSLAAFAVLVLALNVTVLRAWRRGRRAEAPAVRRRR